MSQWVNGRGWTLCIPDGLSGGPLRHAHLHPDTMTQYRGFADDGTGLEVIVTTFPGAAVGEQGQRLDRGGVSWKVAGARRAVRREQITQLDDDPASPPVATTIIVARSHRGSSVCLVVHRPTTAAPPSSEAIVRSLALVDPAT